jgi:uncharacterized membrane protein YkoI
MGMMTNMKQFHYSHQLNGGFHMKRFLNTTTVLTGLTVLFLSAGFAIGDDGKDKESVQAMAAKITMEQAIQTAKTKFPGRVVEAELESEDGTLVYEVEIVSASGEEQEIEIDAQSGKILDSESENEKDKDDAQKTKKS